MLKGLKIRDALARVLDMFLPTVAAAVADFEALDGHGAGEEDTSALIRLRRGADSQINWTGEPWGRKNSRSSPRCWENFPAARC